MARLILILLFSTLVYSAQSQLTLAASSLVQDPGDEFFIDITTQGFDSIAAIQLTMKWDSSVIEFLDIDNFGLPTSSSNPNIHFSFAYLSSGYLTFLWDPGTGGTVDLPDNTSIMRLKYKAIGAPSSSSPFEFVGTITAISVLAGSDLHQVNLNLEPGEVKLTPVLGIHGIAEIEEMLISPNPSSQDIGIQFSLDHPVDLAWSVSDMQGKEIISRQFAKADGQQTIKIDRDLFPATGVYLFSMRSAHGVLTQKLIVQ